MQLAPQLRWDIYEEHLTEAAFLWGQWEAALLAPNYTLLEVARGPEERLRAHLDGLVLGGRAVAERLLLPALRGDEPQLAFAAAWALLHAEHGDHLELVSDALCRSTDAPARAALARAFELCARTDLADRLLPRLPAAAPELQACLVDVISARGPGARLPLQALASSQEPALRAAVLRALLRRPDPAFAPLVSASLDAQAAAERDAALEAGVRLGVSGVREACRRWFESAAPGLRLPLAWLVLDGDARDQGGLLARASDPVIGADVIWALGFAGSVAAADVLVALLDDPKLAALAAEAFSSLSGLSIDGPLRKPGTPADLFEPSDLEAPVPEVQPGDDLPVPEPEPIRAWWQGQRSRWDPHLRYVLGRPAGPDVARQALALGPMWRRRGFRLSLAGDALSQLDLRAWARAQRLD
jgi:uncharacterized protein (TIGR02270 family)